MISGKPEKWGYMFLICGKSRIKDKNVNDMN